MNWDYLIPRPFTAEPIAARNNFSIIAVMHTRPKHDPGAGASRILRTVATPAPRAAGDFFPNGQFIVLATAKALR